MNAAVDSFTKPVTSMPARRAAARRLRLATGDNGSHHDLTCGRANPPDADALVRLPPWGSGRLLHARRVRTAGSIASQSGPKRAARSLISRRLGSWAR